MKKILISIFICGIMVLGVVGCGNKTKEVNNLKETYNKVNEYFGNEKADRSNLSAYSLDEENNVIIITLVNNSKEKQEDFMKKVGVNSKYIKFEQGGPHNTLGMDFYIIKPINHNDIRFNSYYTVDNRTIYLAGNIEEFYIVDSGSKMTLKYYISNANQTFNRSIQTITDKLELKNTLNDGGTKIYKSKEKDITMIVCNTTKNDRNIFIGDYSIEYTEGDCKN